MTRGPHRAPASPARKHHSPSTSDPRDGAASGISTSCRRRPIDAQEAGHRLPDKLLAAPGKETTRISMPVPNLPGSAMYLLPATDFFPCTSARRSRPSYWLCVPRPFRGQAHGPPFVQRVLSNDTGSSGSSCARLDTSDMGYDVPTSASLCARR